MSVLQMRMENKSRTELPFLCAPCDIKWKNVNNANGSTLLISIINLMFILLLLLLYADVCKSNEYSMTTEVAADVVDDIDSDEAVIADGDNTSVRFDSVSADIINQTRFIVSSVMNEHFKENNTIQNATQNCLDHCNLEANQFLNEYGLGCNINDSNVLCFRMRCINGCQQWWKTIINSENCQDICFSAALFSPDLPCISACEYGQQFYWNLLQSTIEPETQIMQPHILSYKSTNRIKIQWKIQLPDSYFANHQFNIQYLHITNDSKQSEKYSWKNLVSYDCSQIFECEIFDDLIPFSSYKFRFKLNFGNDDHHILYSLPTDAFITSAKGSPISKPILKLAYALDHSHITAFWEPGEYCNGPLTGYKLILKTANYTFEKVLEQKIKSFVFNHLSPSTNYNLKLAIINKEGTGPFMETTVLTKEEDVYDNIHNTEPVLVAGEYSIKLKSLDRLFDTKVLFESEELISDYSMCSKEERLFVVDISGNVYSISLRDNIQKHLLPFENQLIYFKPKKISVDWLNRQLFFAGERSSKEWGILKTDFNGNFSEILIENLAIPIEYIDVDPVNGWLFWRQKDGLIRMDLAQNNTEFILRSSHIGHFFNDYERTLLMMYNKSDNEVYEATYDGLYIEKSDIKLPKTLAGEIQVFMLIGIAFLASNGTHIISQNYKTTEYSIWSVKEVEWCWSLFPLAHKHKIQPHISQTKAPNRLHALLTSKIAKITWEAPTRKVYQTEYAWQGWEYELEIMDVASNSAFNIRNIRTKYFKVEKLQPNNLYMFRVRIVNQSGEGEWSDPLLTRTWPLGEYKFLIASANGFYEVNEVGEYIKQTSGMKNIQEFVQLNGTIYYISKEKNAQCANIMNPEVNCTFMATNAVSLAYDWRGGKIYWIDTIRNCVLRASLDGSNRELFPIFGARIIKIDPDNGFIYYTNGIRLVRCHLGYSTDTINNEYEFYQVSTYDDIIRDFTFDLTGRRIFWIVRQIDGRMQLFQANIETNSQNAYGVSIESDLETGTMQYLHEIDSLLWVQFNTTRIVLTRTSNLTNDAFIDLPQLNSIHYANLRYEYTPYIDFNVIPDAVDTTALNFIDDYSDNLNIKWNPLISMENITVFYNILVQYNEFGKLKSYQIATNQSSLRIENLCRSQKVFNISITPYSYWSMGPSTQKQLRLTSTKLDIPKHLRIFVEYFDDPLQITPNVSAIIRWEPPENISLSTETNYKIQCWQNVDLFSEIDYNSSNTIFLETYIYGLRIGELYRFEVQALDNSRLNGGEKATLQIQVKPEIQSRPHFLYATNEFIAEFDLDLNIHKLLVNTTNEVEHFASIKGERLLLWVNENVELISFVVGAKPTKLARMRAEVLSLAVDWIQRIVYWTEMDTDDEHTVCIYKLDLCRYEGRIMQPEKLFTLEKGMVIKDLIVLPFSNTLIWLATDSRDKLANSTIMAFNLTNFDSLPSKTGPFRKMYLELLADDVESVNFIDINGNNCVYEEEEYICEKQISLLNDTDGVNTLESDSEHIYVVKSETVYTFDKQTQSLKYQKSISNLKNIKAEPYQKLPERKCLLAQTELFLRRPELLNPETYELGENFCSLRLPRVHLQQNCSNNIPGISYSLTITDNDNLILSYTTYENIFQINYLRPFTKYNIQLAVSSYYQKKLKLPILHSEIIFIQTDIGTPSAPENFIGYAISPTQIRATWNAPLQINSDKVWYLLHWQMQKSTIVSNKRLNFTSFTIPNLEFSHEYTIWLQVFSTEDKFNVTSPINVKTFDDPYKLSLVSRTANNITLNWFQSVNVTRSVIVCREINGNNEFSMEIRPNVSHIIVPNLEPKTKYAFYLELSYGTNMDPYVWPELPNEWFVYETLGDIPGRPGQPQIEHIANEIFKVFWEPAKNNGEPITTYSLEALQARNPKRIKRESTYSQVFMTATLANHTQLLWAEEPKPMEDRWIMVCNTSEFSCIIRELHSSRLLMFRVRARNDLYGWGPYSPESERVLEPFVSPEKRESLVLAIITPAAIVSSCVLILIILRTIHIRRVKAKKLLEKGRPSIWSNISSMQHQQLMTQHSRAFSLTSHSTLYTGGPLSDADIALLPHISWHQITLQTFLGSGAFGEVYEGLITYDGKSNQEKVAIKSLRKGSNEFPELLQEAQIMSNFNHENIVRLIGVSSDSETISIIMEYMEGGELLNYLRESCLNSKESIIDLINMCVDVAKGCCYLEEMQFVHRNLACRNCLVSSRVPSKRVVKISDFGLPRDTYKNDFCRKEGEGRLPVRWMAPECLIDGIFTTQSDIWAFAVLCWEVLTLGQQPYATRNNYEILNYIKDGRRLEKPRNCPDKLFMLMMKCWNSQPDERPTFQDCLHILIATLTDVRRISLGYTTKNTDYMMYANSHPLPTVKVPEVGACPLYDTKPSNGEEECSFNNFCQDVDIETLSNDSQLIESELNSIKIAPTFYENEGISKF